MIWKTKWLVSLGLVMAAVPTSLLGQQALPEVFVREGACPFECCQFGRWVSNASIDLGAEPTADAPIVATISPGDTVFAVTGQVRSVPRPFLVEESFEGLEAGDTIWVLDFDPDLTGYTIWTDGEIRTTLLGLTSGGLVGRMLAPSRSAWWVRIRLGPGVEGWTSETEELYGKDACACT